MLTYDLIRIPGWAWRLVHSLYVRWCIWEMEHHIADLRRNGLTGTNHIEGCVAQLEALRVELALLKD